MTDTQTVPAVPPTPMTSIKVRLGDLGLASENLRFKEPADDGVPQLADTILAAGVRTPPRVRPRRQLDPSSIAARSENTASGAR